MNSPLLDALRCQNSGPTPLWFMRQAGRTLPTYRALREKHTLKELFFQSDLITQVSLLPTEVFEVDALIIFSDILMVLEALDVAWNFGEKSGPILPPFREDLSLKPAAECYGHLERAIRSLKASSPLPLLGFAGAPFTIASYLIEGKTSRDLLKTKEFLYTYPEKFEALLEHLSLAITDLLRLQIEAGVDAIQIFDSWAGVLPEELFQRYCCQPIQKILKSLNSSVPVILFARGSCLFASSLASLGAHALSLDWSCKVSSIRQKLPSIALQGNLDPALLLGNESQIKHHAMQLLSEMQGDPGFIFNLGHGLLPQTPLKNIQYLVEVVKSANRVLCHT